MGDKTMSLEDLPQHVESGMTLGIGGWGSRRKPMAMVRQLLRSDVTDLTVVTLGGPDVGLLCAAGKVRKLIYGFVSLDSIPLGPSTTRACSSPPCAREPTDCPSSPPGPDWAAT
jgi:glutaconate CoA-transferase subunit A